VDLHQERSLDVVFPIVSVKDHTVVGPPVVRDFATGQMPSCERLTAHWEWRDGESSVYPHSQGLDWRCTMLSGGAGPGHVLEDPGEG
jgi:hypothetical protein